MPPTYRRQRAQANMNPAAARTHGSATHEERVNGGEKVIDKLGTFMDGHRPPDRVLPSIR